MDFTSRIPLGLRLAITSLPLQFNYHLSSMHFNSVSLPVDLDSISKRRCIEVQRRSRVDLAPSSLQLHFWCPCITKTSVRVRVSLLGNMKLAFLFGLSWTIGAHSVLGEMWVRKIEEKSEPILFWGSPDTKEGSWSSKLWDGHFIMPESNDTRGFSMFGKWKALPTRAKWISEDMYV